MNAPTPKSGGWLDARFLLIVVVLFAIQAGLVLTFAERPRAAVPPPVSQTVFRRLKIDLDETTLSKYIFASDPTIFPSSFSGGFADQAWLRLPPVEYNKTTSDSEAPSFLEFAANPFRPGVQPPPVETHTSFDFPDELALPQEPAPIYTAANEIRSASFLRIEGPLRRRRIDVTMPPREWPENTVLSNTVVSFGVNRSGEVFSASLWSGSGSPDADASAVNTVNAMRFTPISASTDDLTWDRATFFWRTVAPSPGTNSQTVQPFP